VQQYIKGIPNT